LRLNDGRVVHHLANSLVMPIRRLRSPSALYLFSLNRCPPSALRVMISIHTANGAAMVRGEGWVNADNQFDSEWPCVVDIASIKVL